MSDTSTPQPEQGRPSGASGAEAPGQAEQHGSAAHPEQAPPAQQPEQPQAAQQLPPEQPAQAPQPQATLPPPAPLPAGRPAKVRRSPSDTGRLVVAAGVGAALLAIGGIGGYFVGAAAHDGPDRPGLVRFGDGDHRQGPFPGRPDRPGEFRGELPDFPR